MGVGGGGGGGAIRHKEERQPECQVTKMPARTPDAHTVVERSTPP